MISANRKYDPAMDMLNEIADTTEGAELLKRIKAKKQKEIEEEFKKIDHN